MQSSTPGREALTEAMRLESARIYGALQREHHNEPAADETATALAKVTPIDHARRRLSA